MSEEAVKESSHTPPRGAVPLSASWLSAMMLFGPLSILAELLITRTHHRPLGAATFASAAVLLWILAEISSRRLSDPSCPAKSRKVAWGLSSALATAVLIRGFL